MKYLWRLLFIAGAIAVGLIVFDGLSEPGEERLVLAGVDLKYMLEPHEFSQFPAPVSEAFGVMPDGAFILGAGDKLYLVERSEEDLSSGEISPDDDKTVDSFALDSKGALITISGLFLGQLEESGYTQALPLPGSLTLAPSHSPGTVYLYGKTEMGPRAYAFFADGRFIILAETPASITAVADSEKRVFLATRDTIFAVTQDRVDKVFRLPPGNGLSITGLAVDPKERFLAFATSDQTYIVRGPAAVSLVTEAGGVLRMRGGSLYLLDVKRQLLMRFSNIDQALAGKD